MKTFITSIILIFFIKFEFMKLRSISKKELVSISKTKISILHLNIFIYDNLTDLCLADENYWV